MKQNYKKHYKFVNDAFKALKIDHQIVPVEGTDDYDIQMRYLYEKFKQYLIDKNPKIEKIISKAKVAPDMGIVYLLRNMNENPDNLKHDF
ncbi:MAG: hypothetical protein AAB422_00385 [Planctomycetota bacterium]